MKRLRQRRSPQSRPPVFRQAVKVEAEAQSEEWEEMELAENRRAEF